jgi:FkbM family methyltransferase
MRTIFLDCGANRGQSIIYAKRKFGEHVEIHSIEAVPVLYSKLLEKWEYDTNVTLYNNACWIKDEELKIYIATTYSDASTLYTQKLDRPISPMLYNNVMGIDMARFIRENFSKEDYIILKFDIEGAEYDLMYHLSKQGILEYINEVWGEWHLDKFSKEYIESDILYKHQHIQAALQEHNLEFKHWDVELLPEDYSRLTLDSSNKMPLAEIKFDS